MFAVLHVYLNKNVNKISVFTNFSWKNHGEWIPFGAQPICYLDETFTQISHFLKPL